MAFIDRLRPLWLFLFWSGVVAVTVLSVLPGEQLPETGLWDKLSHALAYGALAGTGGLSYPSARDGLRLGIGLLLLGGGLEIVQGFLPGRMASLEDLLANGVGIALGLALLRATFAVLRVLTRR